MSGYTVEDMLFDEQLERRIDDILQLLQLRQPELNWRREEVIRCALSEGLNLLRRRHRRKYTNLSGVYRGYAPDMAVGSIMTVENLSMNDIGFRTREDNFLREKQILDLEFILDDERHSLISRRAIIRRVDGAVIGAEFCEPDDLCNAKEELARFLE